MRELLAVLALAKPFSSLTIALVPLAAFALTRPPGQAGGGPLFLGVALLAAGCSALNQWQERDRDATMARTRGRPLPAGLVSPPVALILAGALQVAGLGVLLLTQRILATWLAGAGAVWYNFVYTPLKRRHALAAFPGTLSGCLLPMIGWEAAGWVPDRLPALLVLGFSVVWQIVHVALLELWWEQDYAGSEFPCLYRSVGRAGLGGLAAAGMVGAGGLALVLPLEEIFATVAGTVVYQGFSLAVLVMGLAALAVSPTPEMRRGMFIAWHLWLGIGLLMVVFGAFPDWPTDFGGTP